MAGNRIGTRFAISGLFPAFAGAAIIAMTSLSAASGADLSPAAKSLAATKPAMAPSTLPTAPKADVGVEAGQVVKLGSRTVAVRLVDVLPFVDNEFTRRYVFDKHGNPKLGRIRTDNRLDEVIARGKDEFEKQLLLMDWVHAQIEYGDPIQLGKMRNAQEIIDLSKKEQKLFCSQFAALMVSAAASLGWVYRPIGIPTHSFGEIWSNQHRRWILMDPTSNWYVEKDNEPQTMYQVRKEWFENGNKNHVFLRGKDRLKVGGREFGAYYILIYGTSTALLDGVGGGGNLITRDQWSEGKGGPTQYTMPNPAVDPYFPINQAAVHLTPDGENYKVSLRTLTPNFKTFRIRVDGKEWTDSGEALPWALHAGENILEARSVNLFGVEGPVSRVELVVLSGELGKDGAIVVPAMAFSSQGGGKVKVSDQDAEMPPSYAHHWFTKGHWLEWNIPDAESGDYDLTLTYSTRYHLRRGLDVNGQPAKGVESIEVGPTGNWGNFSDALVPGKVTLKTGSNVLRLTCQDDASMCLSKLTLSLGKPGKKDLVIDAVTAAEGGGTVERIYAPRGGFFRMWTDANHVLEYAVDAPEAGEYQVFFRYGAMYPAPRELRVNGGLVPGLEKFTLPVNGGWQEWVEAPLPAKVTLKAGRNVLRFAPLGGQGINMSDIRLARPGKPDIFISAVDFAKQEGGKVMEYRLSRHGFVYAWGAKGQWLEWTFQCPKAGEYNITLRRANQNATTREVSVNGKVAAGLEKVALDSTGGGQAWQETVLLTLPPTEPGAVKKPISPLLPAKVQLKQGANTIRITNVSGSVSLDEIVFTPAK